MSHGLVKFKVVHNRFLPKKYKFIHNLFMFKVDLNDLDNLPTPFISHQKINLYSFYDGDHINAGKKSAKENYIEIAKKNGVTSKIIDIHLYSQLRFLGYIFNPVSFILMKDENNLQYAIIEIGNTFNELKVFFVDNNNFKENGFVFTTKKYFYISPFIDHDNEMTFYFKQNAEKISIVIDDKKEIDRILQVSFDGSVIEASLKNLLNQSFFSPFITIKIIYLIHWHAFRLWKKGLPYFKKEENMHIQKGAQRWKT